MIGAKGWDGIAELLAGDPAAGAQHLRRSACGLRVSLVISRADRCRPP